MKNIINNEQMISIIDLKKQAKIARKQNNNLSNHSQSLKAIAQSYNYDSWENLLDAAYLIIKEKPQQFKQEQIHCRTQKMLEHLNEITHKMNKIHVEYNFLNNEAGYNALFNFFQIHLLHVYNISTPIYQKIKLIIDFMIESFIEYRKVHQSIEFKEILSFAIFGNGNPYYKKELSTRLSDKLKKYMNLNNLNVQGYSSSTKLKIFDMSDFSNTSDHNEVLLILDSLHEKINIMSTIHDVIEKQKNNNTYLSDWLSMYENFVGLSLYSERDSSVSLSDQIQDYQKLMRSYFSSFFSDEDHKKALSYLNHFLNGRCKTITFKGSIKDIKNEVSLLESDEFEYDIKKAMFLFNGKNRDSEEMEDIYECMFYYVLN